MNNNIVKTLNLIAKRLNDKHVHWVVFGSCGLALNGLDVEPEDIDILTDEDGLAVINDELKAYKVALPQNLSTKLIDSTMFKFVINECSIEAMCNFKVKSHIDNQWHETSHLLVHPRVVDCGDAKIPVLPLTSSIELYMMMGRAKDLVKIKKIESYLKSHLNV